MSIHTELDYKKYKQIKHIAELAKDEIIDVLYDSLNKNDLTDKVNFIESRIKTYDSLINKMKYKGYELTETDMIKNINDFIGIRFVCGNVNDVYKLAKCVSKDNDIKIIKEKDYIKNPKKTGYKSYHIIILYNVKIKNHLLPVKAELQIRTYQMELWANWAHDLIYKREKAVI